jgi:protein-L-isoaspartate(D-aspartate) O-methyltransferase
MDLSVQRARLTEYLIKYGILKTRRVIKAFEEVPRHLFVADETMQYAYHDIALPIANESTISQPSTVATMLELLQPGEDERILEIGTGSGWETCLLSKCVGEKGKVITMEIDPEIEKLAMSNIRKMKLKNIKTIVGDGSGGYAKGAPYDKIVFTAATPRVGQVVFAQLKPRGRIVAPVGGSLLQTMKVFDKVSDTKIEVRDYGTFQFVPLRGRYGEKMITA